MSLSPALLYALPGLCLATSDLQLRGVVEGRSLAFSLLRLVLGIFWGVEVRNFLVAVGSEDFFVDVDELLEVTAG